MQMLNISDTLSLPLDTVTETLAFLAKRGSGKTYAASVLVEEMLMAALMVVVIDPVGVWWGLRTSADGQSPGLPIAVLGGEHGDVPLDHESGEQVAMIAVEQRIPMVIDLSLFSKGQMERFVTDFAETIYRRNRQPLHLVFDEADAFAPQTPAPGQQRMLGAINDIVRRGRARGLGVTLITQRPAAISKSVLTQTEVLIALRTSGHNDRQAIDDWMKAQSDDEKRKQLLSSLAALPVGRAWVSSAGWLNVFEQVQIRRRKTYDSSATPKLGDAHERPAMLASVDVARLTELLQPDQPAEPNATPADCTAAEREITHLRAQVADLEQRLADRVAFAVDQIEQMQTAANNVAIVGSALLGLLRGPDQPVPPEHRLPFIYQPRAVSKTDADPPARTLPPTIDPPPPVLDNGETITPDVLKKGETTILSMLARRYPTRMTRAQVGTLSGYTASGGAFGGYFSRLRKLGLIVEQGDDVSITQTGFAALGQDVPTQPQTPAELQSLWQSALRPSEWKLLSELIAVYPNPLTRDELGDRTGYTASGGAFGDYLGTLRRNDLVLIAKNLIMAAPSLMGDETP